MRKQVNIPWSSKYIFSERPLRAVNIGIGVWINIRPVSIKPVYAKTIIIVKRDPVKQIFIRLMIEIVIVF